MNRRKVICIAAIAASLFLVCACSKKEAVTITTVAEEEIINQGQPEEMKAEANEETNEEAERLLIHICGAVQIPGVYELSEGDRVCHAIEAAGGFTDVADEDYLNQAGRVTDGMRIYIPTKEETDLMQKSDVLQSNDLVQGQIASDSLVNINTATLELLCTLPGIGEGKAKNIIAYRTEKGGYASIEEIMNVEGIKEGLFEKIRDRITVS